MKIFRLVAKYAFAALCPLLPLLAHADTVLTLDANFAAPDYAFYSYTDTSGGTHSSIPVSPYKATLTGGSYNYNNTPALVICYDFNSATPVGTALSGTVEPVTYFTGSTYTEVMESTFLINMLYTEGGLRLSTDTRGAISFAIWEIMNPSSTTSLKPFPADPASVSYESEAASAVAGGAWTPSDAAQYPTWVPANPAYQRFGMIDLAPEPSTLVLTGLGLLGLSLAGGRSKGRAIIKVRRDH
jgi:hypothetical protein